MKIIGSMQVAYGNLLLLLCTFLAGSAWASDPTGPPSCHGTAQLRHWSTERDDRILQRDGLPTGPHPDYEIDHRIPLCLNGPDADSNLWAQPRKTIEPFWNAERKDELEWALCRLVCAGHLDQSTAWHDIENDWKAAYKKYFPDVPTPDEN